MSKTEQEKPVKKAAAKKPEAKAAAPKKEKAAAPKVAMAEAKEADAKPAKAEKTAAAPKKEKAAKKDKKDSASKKPKGALLKDVALYDIIRTPVVTEKSTMASEQNKVVFKVLKSASKERIREAVEQLFGVNVVSVNTITTKGKTKRFRGVPGTRSDVKKAIVTLKAGQTIELAAGAR